MTWLIEMHHPNVYYPYQFIPLDESHLPQERVHEILDLSDQADEWCREQFGYLNRDRWMMFSWGFLFRNPLDATAFKLRWL